MSESDGQIFIRFTRQINAFVCYTPITFRTQLIRIFDGFGLKQTGLKRAKLL